MFKLRTPAKINLALEVIGKREDGYHEIKSVVQSVGIYDELVFEHASQVEFHCELDAIPADNLVIRAAKMLKDLRDYSGGAAIKLKKEIPVSAGLGGGSSDAAATLAGLNKLWKLGLSSAALMEIAGRLGSDVPFFIQKGTALAEGRGEKIQPLPPAKGWAVLGFSTDAPMNNKTAIMYSKLESADFSDGSRAERIAAGLRAGKMIDSSLLYNAFDRVSKELSPYTASAFSRFKQAGASDVHLAGSGPTLYSLCGDKKDAAKLVANLKKADPSGNYIACKLADK